MLRTGQSRRRSALWLVATALAALGIGGLAPTARAADMITFDPDGFAPGNAPRSITSLDWQVGNAVSIGGNPVVVGEVVELYYQARLAATIPPSTLNGINTVFEITGIARFREMVTSLSATKAQFQIVNDNAFNFIEIYYDTTPDSDDLAGVGFDDGTLILSGDPVNNPDVFFDSNFTITRFNGNQANGTTPILYDNVDTDDYSGTGGRPTPFRSVTGSGNTTFDAINVVYNSAFFNPGPGLLILTTNFVTNQVTPFDQVDPSMLFFGDTVGQPGHQGTVTPALGTGNGPVRLGGGGPLGTAALAGTGPDFQFQADATQSFTVVVAAVPEPGTMTLALTGVGLTSLAALRRRRRPTEAPAA